jgi:hypothetical protein
MATRAEPFQFLLAGLRDPDTLLPLAAGKVYFYETGTTTPKNAWTEDDKTNAYTSFTLDSNGVAELFGDGNYKVVVKDSAGATEYTFDPVKMGSAEHHNRTVSTSPITVTPEDDLIICDTSSNAITLQPQAVANFTRPVKVKVTSSNYDVTWDPNGAETVDGAATATLTGDDDSGEFFPDQAGGEWKQANRFSGLTASIAEINTAADGITNPPLIGDSTAGRVLRVGHLWITDGTDASTIACQLFSDWNGDAIAEEDNLAAGTPGTYFSLNQGVASQPWIEILTAGLSGNCIAVISATIYLNDCGTDLLVWGIHSANKIKLFFQNPPNSGNIALSTLVDTGVIYISIAYITDA